MEKARSPGRVKAGTKPRAGCRNRGRKCVLMFDDKDRNEFLTGFHKRKVERRKAAVEEIKNKLREEQKRLREERQKEYLKMLKERREALEDADELDDVITSTTESVQYDHPNHTVTVTTISDLDLSGARLLQSLTNQAAGASDEDKRGDEEEKVEALPRKAGNPLLSKKIQSLSASLHSFTKQKKKKKSKMDIRGRSQQGDRKSLVAVGNKHHLGRTTKKQRRRRTGRKERSAD